MGRNNRIVVEAKEVRTLRPQHINETLNKYKYPYRPDRFDMHIPRHTKVSHGARKVAKQKNVKIRRLWGY